MDTPNYVIITPARNEEAYIEKTIQSVISQTILPRKWIIVSDGSTDKTEEIISRYAKENHFIQLLTSKGDLKRNFGSKVNAFNAGYQLLKDMSYDFICNLDADVTFSSNYFESILQEFDEWKQIIMNIDANIDEIPAYKKKIQSEPENKEHLEKLDELYLKLRFNENL